MYVGVGNGHFVLLAAMFEPAEGLIGFAETEVHYGKAVRRNVALRTR